MSSVKMQGNAGGTGSFTVASPNSNNNQTITLPDATGTAVVATATSSSVTNSVTNKIAINIGGVTYYLLASTSGT